MISFLYNFAAFTNRTSYIYHMLICIIFYNSDYFIKTKFSFNKFF